YVVMNSFGVIVPSFCTKEELKKIEGMSKNLLVLENDRFCAVANNIACNDYGAIVNPNFPDKEIKKIEKILEVPVYKKRLGKWKTIGMMMVTTNKGYVVSNKTNDKDLEELKEILKVSGNRATVNLGLEAVGLGIIANSKIAFVGRQTSGFELSKIAEGLDILV
ncbi:MAG: hypothetical protein ACK4J0_04200, partial [Candidatus Anstonellaceae archaeon]